MENKFLLEEYFTRREWLLRLQNVNLAGINRNSQLLEIYNIIQLKNRMKRYFVLRKTKSYKNAKQVIETELEYCEISLISLITNNYKLELRNAERRVTNSFFSLKIVKILFGKKEI